MTKFTFIFYILLGKAHDDVPLEEPIKPAHGVIDDQT